MVGNEWSDYNQSAFCAESKEQESKHCYKNFLNRCFPVIHVLFCFDIPRNMLEKNLELLMDYVDDLAQETNKYMNYQRAMTKLQQNKQQYTYKRVSFRMSSKGSCLAQFPFEISWRKIKPSISP